MSEEYIQRLIDESKEQADASMTEAQKNVMFFFKLLYNDLEYGCTPLGDISVDPFPEHEFSRGVRIDRKGNWLKDSSPETVVPIDPSPEGIRALVDQLKQEIAKRQARFKADQTKKAASVAKGRATKRINTAKKYGVTPDIVDAAFVAMSNHNLKESKLAAFLEFYVAVNK